MFHRVEIARQNRNTPYLTLLADGPSGSISIMEFRAHSQKFTNSSQHQDKLNNAVALELWKADPFFQILEQIDRLQSKQAPDLIVES